MAIRKLLLRHHPARTLPAPPVPPTILTSGAASVTEGGSLPIALVADQTVAWSIVGGADMAQFSLGGTGNATLTMASQTYVAGGNNNRVVTVRATNTTTSLYVDKTITVAITSVAAGVNFVTPGSAAFGTWAMIAENDATLMQQQGSVADKGYSRRPAAGWTTFIYDRVTDVYYIGVTAWKRPTYATMFAGDFRAIQSVKVAADNGTWVNATLMTHPVDGNVCYVVGVRASDWPASRKSEFRAIIYPKSGKPVCLQGRATPAGVETTPPGGSVTAHNPSGTSPDPRVFTYVNGSTYRAMAFLPDSFSVVLTIDKGDGVIPNHTFYKAPEGFGNDNNSGLTAAAPLATWPAIMDKLEAASGGAGSDIGGSTVICLAGQHKAPGFDSVDGTHAAGHLSGGVTYNLSKMYKASGLPLVIMADPNAASGSVQFTSKPLVNLLCEKIKFCGSSHTNRIFSSVTLDNSDGAGQSVGYGQSSGNLNFNYGDTFFEYIDWDGGPGVIPGTVGVNAYAQQPSAPPAVGGSWGHCQIRDFTMTRLSCTGLDRVTTLAINGNMSYIGSQADIIGVGKVLINLTISNTKDDYPNGNHLDASQWLFDRGLIVIEDFTTTSTYVGQGLFQDLNAHGYDCAIIRPHIQTGSFSHGLEMGLPTNTYVLNPQFTSGDPTTGSLPGQITTRAWDFGDSSIVMWDPSSVAANFEWNARNGLSIVYPQAMAEPIDQFPATTAWSSLSPGKLLEVYDANVLGSVTLVNAGSSSRTDSRVRIFRDLIGGADLQQHVMADNPGTTDIDRRRPAWSSNAFNGHPAIDFNVSLYAGGTDPNGGNGFAADGQPIGQGLGGAISHQAAWGWHDYEIWFCGDNQNPYPTSDRSTRTFFGMGPSTGGDVALYRYCDTSGNSFLAAQMGYAPASTLTQVSSVEVQQVGQGYSSAPTYTPPGGGTGFTCTVQMAGTAPNMTVAGVTITNPGTGYSEGLGTFSGGGGTGAQAYAWTGGGATSNAWVTSQTDVAGFGQYGNGRFFVRLECLSDRIRMTVYNAAHPTGYICPDGGANVISAGSNKYVGTVGSNNPVTRSCFGGDQTIRTGAQKSFAIHYMNSRVITKPLTATERDAYVSEFRSRCGF